MPMNLGLDRVIWTAVAADKDNGGFATREEIQSYYAGRRNQGATTATIAAASPTPPSGLAKPQTRM